MPGKRSRFFIIAALALSGLGVVPRLLFSAGVTPDVLLTTMQRELQRASAGLAKSDPAPYFLGYAVSDVDGASVVAENGSVLVASRDHRRLADVTVRVGSAALDNTHAQARNSGMSSGLLPLTDDPDATARVLWQLTNREYEQAKLGAGTGENEVRGAGGRRRQVPGLLPGDTANAFGRYIAKRAFLRREDLERPRAAPFRRVPEISRGVHFVRLPVRGHGQIVSGDHRRHRSRATLGDGPRRHSGRHSRRRWHGPAARRDVSGGFSGPLAFRGRTSDQGAENCHRPDRLALRSSGRPLCRPGAAFRTRRSGLLPRSAGPPARRSPAARRNAGSNIHQESRRGRPAAVLECGGRSHPRGNQWRAAFRNLCVRR